MGRPLEDIAANQSTALVGLVVGVSVAIWSASDCVGAFMRASNAVYEGEEGRPFWKLQAAPAARHARAA